MKRGLEREGDARIHKRQGGVKLYNQLKSTNSRLVCVLERNANAQSWKPSFVVNKVKTGLSTSESRTD